jgi:hypothetical protein
MIERWQQARKVFWQENITLAIYASVSLVIGFIFDVCYFITMPYRIIKTLINGCAHLALMSGAEFLMFRHPEFFISDNRIMLSGLVQTAIYFAMLLLFDSYIVPLHIGLIPAAMPWLPLIITGYTVGILLSGYFALKPRQPNDIQPVNNSLNNVVHSPVSPVLRENRTLRFSASTTLTELSPTQSSDITVRTQCRQINVRI